MKLIRSKGQLKDLAKLETKIQAWRNTKKHIVNTSKNTRSVLISVTANYKETSLWIFRHGPNHRVSQAFTDWTEEPTLFDDTDMFMDNHSAADLLNPLMETLSDVDKEATKHAAALAQFQ